MDDLARVRMGVVKVKWYSLAGPVPTARNAQLFF